MMDHETQLKVQAFLDGELPEDEAREIASLLAQDSEVTGLLNELRNTRKAMKDSEPVLRVPESREFYWSKIQKEIERLEPVAQPEKSVSWIRMLKRLLVPASVVAAVAAVGIWVGVKSDLLQHFDTDTETTVADSGTFTYHDYANGTTLVWISYPAER